jgi:hypothetical protein
MFKFISVALVTVMVSTAAVPAFAKGDKGGHHSGGGKGGSSHHMGGLGGKGFGKGVGIAAAAAIFGMALEGLSR